MTVGTKSFLFGVHQCIWHPITVALAWRQIYGVWPKWWEWVAIILHDAGYVGCPDMDGEVGRKHPIAGAELTGRVVRLIAAWSIFLRHPIRCKCDEDFLHRKWWETVKIGRHAANLALGHSRFYAAQAGIKTSRLFEADKLSIRFDPPWFYLLRAKLSGEVYEYIARSNSPTDTPEEWYRKYRKMVEEKFA